MTSATYDDVCRLFPGIQDHAVVDLLAARPSIAELEAVCQMLHDNDEALLELKQHRGGRLNRLYAVLARAQMQAAEDHER